MLIRFDKRCLKPDEPDKTGEAALKTELETLKAAHALLVSENEKLKKPAKKKPAETDDDVDDEEDDADLEQKAKAQREASEKSKRDHKALENALGFNMSSAQFLKDNQTLLPKEAADIITQADKENYETAIDKANAVRAGLIKSFFSVQDNKDLLTQGLKTDLEEYLKLVPNVRNERAEQIWRSIFEPTLEMLRRIKKAAALNGDPGHSSEGQSAYRTRMIALSKKHHLGETQ